MSLGAKQERFTEDFISFGVYAIAWARGHGYTVRLEECYRHPSATHGHVNSLHRAKLAGHFLLFKDGALVADSNEYLPLGEAWEQMNPENRWGGRFSDGNHFSKTHAGMA